MRLSSIVPSNFRNAASALRREREPVEEDGFVLRKEMQVVLERDEIVLRNLGVRRIGVLHIDGAVAERFVAEPVIDALHFLRGEFVALRERPPAIAALDKLVRESELQLRMSAQIADAANAFRLRQSRAA